MDWFSWLSKTGLETSLVYEYGLAFANNELDEEDIAYFNHEFLQSMGISIAKHRLEILKLARREQKSHALKHPMAKVLLVLKKTKKSLANYIATLVHRDDDRALILLPNKRKNNSLKKINKGGVGGGAISYSSRWKKAMMIRSNRKLVMVNGGSNNHQKRLMLTNGDYLGDIYDDPLVVSTPRLDSFSSPLMYDIHQNKEEKTHDGDDGGGVDDKKEDEYWSPALEEIRWDAMFQDLKPT